MKKGGGGQHNWGLGGTGDVATLVDEGDDTIDEAGEGEGAEKSMTLEQWQNQQQQVSGLATPAARSVKVDKELQSMTVSCTDTWGYLLSVYLVCALPLCMSWCGLSVRWGCSCD